MQTEIEAKWLRIDKEELRTKLQAAGAQLVQPERFMRRRIYDYPDGKLYYEQNGWIRVRDEGDKVTLSYKRMEDRTITGTKEALVEVSSFEDACGFLESIGLKCFTVQETRRESWQLDGAEVEIDTWPWIPPFVEVEAKDEKKLRAVAAVLSLDFTKALHGSVEIAYQDVYDVTESEVDNWDEILFTKEVPEWLQAKKKA
jgi:adenylate cyclase, class 2